jgi:hypothetical protein
LTTLIISPPSAPVWSSHMFQQTRNGLKKKVSILLSTFKVNCFNAQLLFSDLENTKIISSLRHKMTLLEAQGETNEFTRYVKLGWGVRKI